MYPGYSILISIQGGGYGRDMTAPRAAVALPMEVTGRAPGRGRLAGRRVLVIGAGQQTHDVEDPPIGKGARSASYADARVRRLRSLTSTATPPLKPRGRCAPKATGR